MNSKEQKKIEFIVDMKALSKQYGYTLDEAMNVIGFRPKTEQEVLLEYADENYTQGTIIVPCGKTKKKVIGSMRREVMCDSIWAWSENMKMLCIYDPRTEQWAEIVN